MSPWQVKGFASAQHEWALIHYEGKGTEQDFEAAFYWLNRAVEQGHNYAKNQLALMYYYSKGTKKNLQRAFHLFKELAEQYEASSPKDLYLSMNQSYISAQYNLARMYEKGEGVSLDFEKALYWYQKAAQRGLVAAQNRLKKLAQQGNAPAQYALARMYKSGKGFKQRPRKAYKWFKAAAEQGHPSAQYELALIYYEGRQSVLPRRLGQNFSKTYHWLIEASQQEYEPASSELVNMVCNGEGAEEDINKAIALA